MSGAAGSGRPFVGRVETVEALNRRFADARAGTGGVTLLLGDTGVGKSTLVASLVRDARARGIRVLTGRAAAVDAPPPFSLVQSAIESARDDPVLRSDENPALGGDQYLIGFALRLGETDLPVPVGLEERLLEVLGGTGDRGRMSPDRVLTGISERFLEFTRHGPTVIVLDDLDRADDSSLAAVEFFANELKDRPLWILATGRPYATLSELRRVRLEKFEAATRAQRIALRTMSSGEVADYLRMDDPSREFSPGEVARRHSETGGNPLLLRQLDRRISSGGEGRIRSGSNLPRLDEEAQRTLDVASVLGPEFPFDLLLRATGDDEERLTEVVGYLVGRGLLYERPGEIYEFPEDRLREEAYGQITELRRRLLHRRAGEALEAMGSPNRTRIYALGRHFYLGRVGGKSVQYNRVAAEIAERALAPEVAREHLSRALESQRDLRRDDHDAESELVLDLARVNEELGRLEEAEEILRQFLDREKNDPHLSPHRRATLEIFLGRVLVDRGDLPAASELAQKILGASGLEDQLLVRVGAHHLLGQSLYYDGRYPEALAHHGEEVRLAQEVGDPHVLARGRVWRVASLAMMGQTEEAIAEAREVTAARDEWGSARESAQAHLFFGDILADARSPPAEREEAIGEYAKAIQFAEKVQDPRRVGWALYKTSELLREKGRLEEASERVRQACDIFGRIGDKVGLSVSIKVRGQIEMDRGSFDLAEADLLEAQRLLRGLNHTLEEIDVLLRLAQLSRARGDRAGAERLVAELERQNLRKARPDLEKELDQLQRALGVTGGDATVP
ncbi:MAG: ATP-binding protein [Thermoplasmata archaeon]